MSVATAEPDWLRGKVLGMTVGVLGAGRMGLGLGRAWARSGHRVVLGSRDPEALAARAGALPSGLSVAGWAEAAAQPIVVLATPFAATASLVRGLAPELAGKVLVDITNPFGAAPAGQAGITVHQAALGAPAAWVAAFKTNFAATIAAADQPAAQCFLAADDAGARAVATELARDAGFAPVDCGGLDAALALDLMVPLMIRLDRGGEGGGRSRWALLPGPRRNEVPSPGLLFGGE